MQIFFFFFFTSSVVYTKILVQLEKVVPLQGREGYPYQKHYTQLSYLLHVAVSHSCLSSEAHRVDTTCFLMGSLSTIWLAGPRYVLPSLRMDRDPESENVQWSFIREMVVALCTEARGMVENGAGDQVWSSLE
jgi:hypothetical protein